MTGTVSSYDQVPYPFDSFPESQPTRLQAVAHLLGLETPAPAECRVLEIGCAVGGNIVPMAYSLPKATLIGIDLAASQIEIAKKFAEASGVKNLDLRAANVTDVTPQLGQVRLHHHARRVLVDSARGGGEGAADLRRAAHAQRLGLHQLRSRRPARGAILSRHWRNHPSLRPCSRVRWSISRTSPRATSCTNTSRA
jgi:SAM-dependent methyltransferase